MRFLHTANWHPGRTLHGVSFLEDPQHILEQIIATARDERRNSVNAAQSVAWSAIIFSASN